MSSQKSSAGLKRITVRVTADPSNRAATEDSKLTKSTYRELTANYSELLRK